MSAFSLGQLGVVRRLAVMGETGRFRPRNKPGNVTEVPYANPRSDCAEPIGIVVGNQPALVARPPSATYT